MNNVSSAWNRALLNDNRDYIEEVTILLADNSTVLQIGNANIWGGGFTIEDAVSEESNFQIGAAIINKFTLVLNNLYDEYNDYVFEDAVLTVRVGLVTEESTEMIQKGRYIVNSAKYNGSLITLECYDFMSKFDKPYDDSFAVTYPATLDTIVRRACSLCGVTLATTDFPHKSYTVTERPESETTTCREVISWVAQIAGCFARMNSLGYLELKWYNQSDLESVMDGLDGGEFDSSTPYSTGDAADGGTFNPWNTGYVYDGGTFTWTNKTHLISSIYSEDISVDDVVITGVRILVKTKDDSGASSETIQAFISGTEGYVIEISENPFITVDNAQEIVNWLGTQLNGFTFRKANVSHGSNPAIEAGDVAVVFDRKGAAFPIVVSKTTFSVGSSQTTISAAQTPTRNSAARYSVETKNYVEMRKRLKTEMTARQQAQADLAQRIASANGLYQTDVTTQGGGTKHYLHNKTNLNESDIQILVSDVGVTMTANGTDAQPTWYGLTVDGTLIANILSVSGINADWINTGHLSANLINSGTMSAARINGGTLTLGGANNQNGLLVVKDANGNNVIIANNSGLTAKGTLTGSTVGTAIAQYPGNNAVVNGYQSSDAYVEDSYSGTDYEYDANDRITAEYKLDNNGLTCTLKCFFGSDITINPDETITRRISAWLYGWRIPDALLVNGALYANRLYMGKNVGKYIYLTDSAGNQYVGLGNNGSNLWIGASQTAAYHHRGGTYISAGYDGTAGNETIFVSVPNATNDGGTNYGVWHKGNLRNATTTTAGLMSAADKSLLSPATTSSNGLMSATDKTFIESEKNPSSLTVNRTVNTYIDSSGFRINATKVGSIVIIDVNCTITTAFPKQSDSQFTDIAYISEDVAFANTARVCVPTTNGQQVSVSMSTVGSIKMYNHSSTNATGMLRCQLIAALT